MSSYFCPYLDSGSFPNNFPSIPYHIGSKPFTILPTIHYSLSPVPTRIRRRSSSRRSRKSHQLCAFPSEYDIVETTEHHDGSLIFRFGDPSEIVKTVEDLETEGEEESVAVKVLDGDHKKDVIVGGHDSGISTNVCNSIDNVGIDIPVAKRESDVDKDISDALVESSERLPEVLQEGDVSLPVPFFVVEDERNVVADISDSEVELSENLPEVSQEGEVTVSGVEGESKVAAVISDSEVELSEGFVVYEVEGESNVVADISDTEVELNEGLLEVSQEGEMTISEVEEESEMATELSDSKGELGEILLETHEGEVTLHAPISVIESESKLEREISESQAELSETMLEVFHKGESELTTKLSDSEEESSERLPIISQEGEVPLPVSVSDIELDDPVNAAIGLENDVDNEECLSEKDEYASLSPVIVTISDDSLSMKNSDGEGVSHDAVEESTEADVTESPTMLNHHVDNSLVESKKTEWEEESSEISEISSIEAIQLELTETSVPREEISTSAFRLSSGAAVLAHPSKALTGGEDAYFLAGSNWLGVADGVSRWSLEGIAPGVYAHELMKNCQNIVSDGENAPMVNPVKVLSRSIEETQVSGSSAVLVAYFNGSDFHVANIGDTGFIIIRHGAIYKKSSPMLHEFNFPLLVESGDDPSQLAEEYLIDLDVGDTIITATDGLFDNLYEQEIAATVSKSLRADMKPEEIAELLATRALEAGGSAASRSPFADAAQAAGYIGYTGGKLDDVAVIVSIVESKS